MRFADLRAEASAQQVGHPHRQAKNQAGKGKHQWILTVEGVAG